MCPETADSLEQAVSELQQEAEALDKTEETPAAPEAKDQAAAEDDPIVASLQVGYRKSGRPFLNAQGTANLLEIQGLLWYATLEINRVMAGRLQTPDPVQVTLEARLNEKLDRIEKLHTELLGAIKALTKALKERRSK